MRNLFLLTALLTTTTAWAQSPAVPPDDRWAAWLGCWHLAEETLDDAARLDAALSGQASTVPTAGARICVAPSPEGGATLTTTVANKVVLTETIVADGRARPVSETGCRGSQQAEWSAFGPRIYARTEITCGNQPPRTVSGLSTVVGGPLWLDVQQIESQGRKSMRIRRYRRAPDQAGAGAPTATIPVLAGKLSLAEIKEAARKVPPETVQAAIFELAPSGYDLDAARLVDLDEAGVPDTVIDLMVALSFPAKFVVERAVPATGPGSYGGGFDDMWRGVAPLGLWGYYADSMNYWSYYSPFGYSNWGYYDPYYYGRPGVVVIAPGGGAQEPSGSGRVVDGQGYTRISPNRPDSPARTSDGSGTRGASGASSGSNSGSSTGGGVSTGGYSGGGGGGGRVAVPRPPG